MCRPGDQYKSNGDVTANPFDDAEQSSKKPQITPYTAAQIATLSSRLEKQLGPEWISSRPGAGGARVYYLEAFKVIELANEVFGFNGWSSSIQNIQIDFVDENPQTGKISLGLSVIMRITLKDGTYHEDVGYGHVENMKGKAAAFEKAKKQGASDGLKRTLRNFGRVLGTCLTDKDYLAKVTKMKVEPRKWDPTQLHRHSSYAGKQDAAIKTEPKQQAQSNGSDNSRIMAEDTTFEAIDFDDAVFDDDEFGDPDEFVLSAEPHDTAKQVQTSVAPTAAPSMAATTPSRPPVWESKAARNPQSMAQPLPGQQSSASRPIKRARLGSDETGRTNVNLASEAREQSSSPGLPSQHFNVPRTDGAAAGRGTGFFSARTADSIDENNNIISKDAKAFNPRAEGGTIRRTPNIDHSKSGVLLRANLQPQLPQAPEEKASPQSMHPPRMPSTGHPQAPQTPTGMNRGFTTSHYRPPTRRGPDGAVLGTNAANGVSGGVDRILNAGRRPPLSDVSNKPPQHLSTATTPDGSDVKRQRIGGSGETLHSDENRFSGEAG